jgi:hypothetical protein
MIPSMIVVDKFLDDPYALRREASAMDFTQAPEFNGHKYPGIVPIEKDTQLFDELQAKVSELRGRESSISMAFLRLSLANEETPVWIHPDACVDQYAGVLYLSRPDFCFGGTAFWQHRGLGWKELPSDSERSEKGIVLDQALADQLNRDGNDPNMWMMTGLLPAAYNRFITYPSKWFHSRWPQEAYGSNFDNGRLILACFYS